MDEKKISNSSIIPLAIISVVCLIVATIIRFITLASGVDSGTANLVFAIVIGACVVLYLIIWAVLGESVIPWVMKKLIKPRSTVPTPDRAPTSIENDEPAEPALPSIAEIKENAEKQLIAKRTEKLNVFLEYTHLTVGPYVSAEGGAAPRLHCTVRQRRGIARRSCTDPRRETLQFRPVPLRLEHGRIFQYRQKIRGRSVVAASLCQPERIGAVLHQRQTLHLGNKAVYYS